MLIHLWAVCARKWQRPKMRWFQLKGAAGGSGDSQPFFAGLRRDVEGR